ncbi:restriction endonuclease subunit S [Chryseobacterium indoltheticum]|uniref:Type I restriction modification DNA specificity domain-containing protein n=1 Tax=Chryseobacterium indoltheticum TaxID=254 RepID=A0A3G6MYD1_9FLAO|nr:restriction endonuclease subunit S [Chryseobacterium indoltheticum]AZA60752.1 hypothetical protein EG340_06725 [Chryseobacterium indoltheticum]
MREDWIECTIKDISKIINGDRGKNYPSRTHYVSNGLPFVSAGNINDSNKLEKSSLNFISQERFDLLKGGFLKQGDILFCIRGSLGKLAIYDLDIDGAIASSLVIVRRLKSVEEKYLLYYLSSFSIKLFINEFNNGTAQPNLSAKDFSNFKFPLPPIPEQRAIVKKLESLFSSLDAGVADLKKAQQQLKVYRQAVLKKAFEGELTNSEMELISLANLTTLLGDGLHGTPKYSDSGEHYFINGNNLKEGKIILKPETKRVDKSEFEKYKKNLGNSTVLVSINGTIGNTAFYNHENVVLGKSACYFNLNDEIDKYYIRYNLTTKRFLHYAVNNATGSTIMNVGLKTMREYLVPVPKNRIEQHQIVKQIESRLSVCDSIEQNIKESLLKAEALRQSILKKAFEGNLLTAQELAECKQAADYEPASVLVERIKAEQKSPADNTDKRRKKAK